MCIILKSILPVLKIAVTYSYRNAQQSLTLSPARVARRLHSSRNIKSVQDKGGRNPMSLCGMRPHIVKGKMQCDAQQLEKAYFSYGDSAHGLYAALPV